MDLELQFDEQSSLKFSGTAQEWAQVHDAMADLDRLMKVRSQIRPLDSPSDLAIRSPSSLITEPAPYPVRSPSSYAPLPLPPTQPEVIEAEARTILPPPALPPAPIRKVSYWKYAVLTGLAIGGVVLGVAFSAKMTPKSAHYVSPPTTANKPKQGNESLKVPYPPPPQKVICTPLPATKPPDCK
jgi:hypothetical protein